MDDSYQKTVRDVYYKAATSLYMAACKADYESGSAARLIAHGAELELTCRSYADNGKIPLTTQRDRILKRLRAQAEMNTPEGRALRDRIVASVMGTKEGVE